MGTARSRPARALLVLLLGAGTVAGLVGLATTASHARHAGVAAATGAPWAMLPDSLEFPVQYAGTDADGVDLVWHGRHEATVPGRMTIRMEFAGAPGDRAMPVWPVSVRLHFSANDGRSSFAAELSGSMNWRSGVMRVAGLVTDGARAGSSLEHRMRLVLPGYDGTATLRFVPRLADGAGTAANH